jgi:hypothetical protein
VALKPTHTWQGLYLHDLSHTYASWGPMQVPTFIPPSGIILPVELKPYTTAESKQDTVVGQQIPGIELSRKWMEGKFGISSADGMVRKQLNYLAKDGGNYGYSEWDLGYETFNKGSFRLLTPSRCDGKPNLVFLRP